MTQSGFAKELAIPVKDGRMDVSAFTEMIAQSTLMKDSRLIGLNNIMMFVMFLFHCIRISGLLV